MNRVLLDASVLVPYNLCDLLLRVAEAGLFVPLWSAEILRETEKALVEKLGLNASKARSRISKMNAAFPAAAIPENEALVPQMTCDPKDRHVLASSVAGDADVLVTANVRDFPAASVEPYGIVVMHPDEFLTELYDHQPGAMHEIVNAIPRRNRKPPRTAHALLLELRKVVPRFAQTVARHVDNLDR